MNLLLIASVSCSVAARLSLFASLLGLVAPSIGFGARGSSIAAACAAGFGGMRAMLRGQLVDRALVEGWREVVSGVRRKGVAALSTPEGRERAAQLVDAVYEVALARATVLSDVLGALVVLAAVLVVTAFVLGVSWLVAGVASGLLLLCALWPVRRALRRSRVRAWEEQLNLGVSLETLVSAAAELRAHGVEARFSAELVGSASRLAAEERRTIRVGGWTAAIPAFLAAAVQAVPQSLLDELAGGKAGAVGVLAAVGVQSVLVTFGAVTMHAKAIPLRESIDGFLGAPRGSHDSGRTEKASQPVGSIRCEGLTVRYGSSKVPTPNGLSFRLTTGGAALVGPNGGGKTTALLALLSLVPIESGHVSVEDVDGEPTEGLRGRAAYLPQRPHVVPDRSVAWHLGLFGTSPVRPDEAERALRAVELWDRLSPRADSMGRSVSELQMGSLSGGERQRVGLARLLLSDADVLLLDEPEAALDRPGRDLLVRVLETEARRRRVLVVAHDESVIPSSFVRIEVSAEG